MNESDFEGTLVLEKLAAVGKVEEFFEAVDADDHSLASSLMKVSGLDSETIAMVLRKMKEAGGER